MEPCFFERDRDRFVPTLWTRGPWDPRFQHAGPAAALLTDRVVAATQDLERSVARCTLEILRPLPLLPLGIEVQPVRAGRRVRLDRAVLRAGEEEVARALVWQVTTQATEQVESPAEPPPFAGPETLPAVEFDPWSGPSYFSGMEWRMAAGAFLEPGPATTWMRMRIPLLDEDPVSAVSRALVAADSGNGISMVLPLQGWLFINTELSLHLFRPPRGEWVALDAVTRVGPSGVGLAESALYDRERRIGGAAQSLLIAER